MSSAPAAGAGATPGPHVFLVAGEESGDRLGAPLMQALKQRSGGRVRFSGVGGTHMVAQGLTSPFPLGDLAIMGFASIPARLTKIIKRIRDTAAAAVAAGPDVLVIIDSPEFTHRVARRVRAAAPTIPIVDYVCPSVWAWRPGRARAMRGYVDHVLALLPFEPAAMARLGGPPCTFVGHPLSERLAQLRPDAAEARRRLSDPPLLLVLPGSRTAEIGHMAGEFGRAVGLLAQRIGTLDVVVPAVPRLAGLVREAVQTWPVAARVVSEPADKDAAYRTARAALTKSGTSTLELAMAGIPMVAGYKVTMLEALVGQMMITASSAILPNLILGENVVPEFLQWHSTPERLAGALLPLMSDTPERARQIEAFVRLDSAMNIGKTSPSERAASVILDCAGLLTNR